MEPNRQNKLTFIPRLPKPLLGAMALATILIGAVNGSELPEGPAHKTPTPIELEDIGMPNLVRVSPSVYSGSEPSGETTFQHLAQHNFKTVVSVDGKPPAVELAKKHRLKTVHIPLSYGELNQESFLALIRVAQDCETPLYIHCHHGTHRGPVAAVIIALAKAELDIESGLQILSQVGTHPDYTGLWKAVRSFQPPPPNTPLPTLQATAPTTDLAQAMAELDRHFAILKSHQEAQWNTELSSSLHSTVVLVREAFSEMQRLHAAEYPPAFQNLLQTSVDQSQAWEQDLKTNSSILNPPHFRQLKQTCHNCHDQFRD